MKIGDVSRAVRHQSQQLLGLGEEEVHGAGGQQGAGPSGEATDPRGWTDAVAAS